MVRGLAGKNLQTLLSFLCAVFKLMLGPKPLRLITSWLLLPPKTMVMQLRLYLLTVVRRHSKPTCIKD